MNMKKNQLWKLVKEYDNYKSQVKWTDSKDAMV